MSCYQSLFPALKNIGADSWARKIQLQLAQAFAPEVHGDLFRWQKVLEELPLVIPSSIEIANEVSIGCAADVTTDLRDQLIQGLQMLHPWRKGPYNLFGIEIDSEWRSDWKWNRLKDHIAPLKNRVVLDVGCGNGYHCWRIFGAGARLVIGIDPTLLSVMQFQAIRKYYGEAAVYVLPLGIEQVPEQMQLFDTIFSMGVLYHRRSPIDHLLELKASLRPGGELILETLVVEGAVDKVLVPPQRYAQMRNVWFLPSSEALVLWMQRCGFTNVRLVNITKTEVEEQRSTDWMRFHSLTNFLDPSNQGLTCEGLPAPIRAIIIANAD